MQSRWRLARAEPSSGEKGRKTAGGARGRGCPRTARRENWRRKMNAVRGDRGASEKAMKAVPMYCGIVSNLEIHVWMSAASGSCTLQNNSEEKHCSGEVSRRRLLRCPGRRLASVFCPMNRTPQHRRSSDDVQQGSSYISVDQSVGP